MLIRYILLFLALLLVVRAVRRLFGGVVQGMGGGGAANTAAPPAMKMARDPICGTYVVPGKALQVSGRGETLYFCSENCRQQWSDAH